MQMRTQESDLNSVLQQKDSLETQIIENQNRFSSLKEEIARQDKINAALDDKLI